jgi:hypothetical protein
MSTGDGALNLEQLIAALARKNIPLPHEIGTFLVLESCERLIGQPMLIGPSEVWLSDEGEVAVAAAHRASSELESARALVVLLGELLVRSAPGVPEMLLELVERAAADESLRLSTLRDELESMLVPLNRAANRRVLSRLLREARKERERGGSMPAPDASALDDELDVLFGAPKRAAGAAPAAAPSAPASSSRFASKPLDSADFFDGESDLAEAPSRRAAKAAPALSFEEAPTNRRQALPKQAQGPARFARDPDEGRLADDLEPFPAERAKGGGAGGRIGIVLVMLALLLGVGYAVLGRDGSRRVLGLDAAPSATPAVAPPAAAAPEAPRYGELRVSSAPARAQVLLLVGKGPALVRGLPIGVAHELVAVSDGRAVARGVVPADAQWTQVDGTAQYELALQLDEGKAGPPKELGATRLPQALGTPTGAVGNVRVVTAPPGASVYQLIGFTPDVRVENMALSEPAELLVYLSGYEPARVAVAQADYKPLEGKLVADLDVTLKAD